MKLDDMELAIGHDAQQSVEADSQSGSFPSEEISASGLAGRLCVFGF